jgi:hypothetical protein
MLRLGDRMQQHMNRFHPTTGSYRELATKDFLVVDLRGPKKNGVVKASDDLCVLYFSKEWDKCMIQMRKKADQEVRLQL